MLNIGDKVKIKSVEHIDGIIDTMHGSPGFVGPMRIYCGKVTTVIDSADCGTDEWVHLHIDNGKFTWDARWLETIRHHVDLQLNNDLFEL